jgi:anti-sigma B factor antagonist
VNVVSGFAENENENVSLSGPKLTPVLQVRDVVSGGHHTLIVSGELDLVSGAELEAAVRGLCGTDTTGIVIDMSELGFIDSTGVRALVVAQRLCEQHGHEFGLVPGPKSIQRIFEVTGLDKVLPFSDARPDG